ncbi:sensor histidine kinase [Corticibacter populi]|nr:ATP-binding protein [Corticibacter populi]
MPNQPLSAPSRFPHSFWMLGHAYPNGRGGRARPGKVTALAILLLLTVAAIVLGSTWYERHLIANSKLVPVTRVLALPDSQGFGAPSGQVGPSWQALDWQNVELPHAWRRDWPGHEGHAWYGISIQIPQNWSGDDLALMVSSASMAHEVFWDSQLIGRDLSLEEPLSRSWNHPSYWRLKTSAGQQHHLLIGVTGYARHGGGLGTVYVGDALDVLRLYQLTEWKRQQLQQFSLGMLLALCVIFTVIWFNWPLHAYYGWYSLMLLGWVGYGYNYIAAAPGWFGSTRAFHGFLIATLLVFIGALWMFSWTLLRRSSLRKSMALWAGLGTLMALLLGVPSDTRWQDDIQLAALLVCMLMGVLSMLQWLAFAWHTRTAESVILSSAVSLVGLTVIHEVAAMQGWLHSPRYFTLLLSTMMLMGIGFVLAQRLARSLEREHHYKQELQTQIEEAEERLRQAMLQNRELEIQKARLEERGRMVRDLHDGLGSTLTGSIARWSTWPSAAVRADEVVDVFQQIHNELRLILETGTITDPHDFMALFANTRLRLQRALENAQIRSQWRTEGLEALCLKPEKALPILRLLQEALTNVIKHSAATIVQIQLIQRAGQLHLHVRDNGAGMALGRMTSEEMTTDGRARGMGLAGMRQRVRELGGAFCIDTAPGEGCHVHVSILLESPAGAVPSQPPAQSGWT